MTLFRQTFNNFRMVCHPRLEPFKFFSAHESVVRDPIKKKKNTEKMLVESMLMNVCKFDSFGRRTTYFFLDFGNLVASP